MNAFPLAARFIFAVPLCLITTTMISHII